MLESPEQIQLTIDLCGEDLVFESGTVKGIPGHVVGNVQNFDSVYDIDMQDIYWQIPMTALLASNIKARDKFSYTVASITYSFEVLSVVDDLIGWAEIRVKHLGVLDVW